MPVSALGWTTLADAELYFENERLAKTAWDALADNDAKNRALNFAYNRLYYSPDFSLPKAGDETAAELVILIKAQSEMAYYVAIHLADEDRRKGLQAQGVIKAGIVKEDYYAEMLKNVPIPPAVADLLDDFSELTAMSMVDIDRDEDESVDTKVDDF